MLDACPFKTLMRVDNRLENYMFNPKGDIWAGAKILLGVRRRELADERRERPREAERSSRVGTQV